MVSRHLRTRALRSPDMERLHEFVRQHRSWHAEYVVTGLLGEYGYDSDHFVRGNYKSSQCDTVDRILTRIAAWGYVIEVRPVGPKKQPRRKITGFSPAQRLAYDNGLEPAGDLREPLLTWLEQNPDRIDVLCCAVTLQNNGLAPLAAFEAALDLLGPGG